MNLHILGFFIVATFAAGVSAAAGDASTAEPVRVAVPSKTAPDTTGQSVSPLPPVYVPPNTGAPKTRIAGTTRSSGDLPELQVLAPDHVGRTTREQPGLWFWLSAETQGRIDLTVNVPGAVAPLAEVTLSGPFAAGFQRIDLVAHSVHLAEGIDYEWFVAIVPDPARRSGDVVAGGAIRRVSPRGAVAASLAAAGEGQVALAYARTGIWYEAIDELSLAAGSGDQGAAAVRAAMLTGEGLELAP